MWLFVCVCAFISCSHENDIIDEYMIKVVDFVPDSISSKDTTSKENKVRDTILCSYEKHMDIVDSYGVGQGAACFEKYLFQGYSNNASVGVFDLGKKTTIGEFRIPAPFASSRIHANTVNFGNQRYCSDDYLPLLYISSGYTSEINGSSSSFIYVYRVIKESVTDTKESFELSLVQTITLKGFGSWTEGILDNENGMLWIKYEPNGTSGEYKYASFPIPCCKDGDFVIHQEDAITDFSIGIQPFNSSNQGHLFFNDKIMLVSGTNPNAQKLAFIVINPKSHKRELVIDLAKIGLRDEPENLFFYNSQLMIGYRKAIYKFTITHVNN